MLTLVCCVLMFQRDPTSMLDEMRWTHPEKIHAMPEARPDAPELQERIFRERFQKLVDALQHFADRYNKGEGNVWPRKEAEALRKAYRNLDRSMFPHRSPDSRLGTSANPTE